MDDAGRDHQRAQLSLREMIACGLVKRETIAGIVGAMLYPNNDFVPDGLTAEEREDLDRAFAGGRVRTRRAIPLDVLPRYTRRAP